MRLLRVILLVIWLNSTLTKKQAIIYGDYRTTLQGKMPQWWCARLHQFNVACRQDRDCDKFFEHNLDRLQKAQHHTKFIRTAKLETHSGVETIEKCQEICAKKKECDYVLYRTGSGKKSTRPARCMLRAMTKLPKILHARGVWGAPPPPWSFEATPKPNKTNAYCSVGGVCRASLCYCSHAFTPEDVSRTHMATREAPVLCGNASKRASAYSKWKNITWIHIPKAGTSWYNTFFHYACPRADKRLELQSHMFWLNNWEQHAWCDIWTRSKAGHGGYNAELDHGVAIALFRRPEQRLLSAFNARLHSFGLSKTSKMKLKGIVKRLEDDGKRVEAVKTYAHWEGMPHAQTKMVLGHLPSTPNITLTDADLATALHRVSSTEHFAFVGITEQYDESVCLFHAMYGGDVLPVEFRNTHPSSSYKNTETKLSFKRVPGTHLYDEGILKAFGFQDRFDSALYAQVVRVFKERLARYDISKCLALAAQQKKPKRKRKKRKSKS